LPFSIWLFGNSRRGMLPRMRFDSSIDYENFLLMVALAGLAVGYLGGTLIAGLFLISDYIVRFFAMWNHRQPHTVQHVDEPLARGTLTRLAEQAVTARRESA
jgi:hypothetical protein